jgi:hypothetical protein
VAYKLDPPKLELRLVPTSVGGVTGSEMRLEYRCRMLGDTGKLPRCRSLPLGDEG